jgi:hypothetical protein
MNAPHIVMLSLCRIGGQQQRAAKPRLRTSRFLSFSLS